MLQRVLKFLSGRTEADHGPRVPESKYRSVEVHHWNNPDACAAVKALAKKRFLLHEAPSLPLAACSDPQACDCRYRRFDDRRVGPRRDADLGIADRLPERVKVEKRLRGRGRRRQD
ncbi:MAG: hypothetical protein AAF515_14750 [Pseudomonadota bacterium]